MIETLYFSDSGRYFEIEVEVSFYREKYGDDADGNRGEIRSYCEVVKYEVSEEVRTMPFWLFSIVKLFNKKAKAWKSVVWAWGELPFDIEERIDEYVNDYEFEETECEGYYDASDDGDRRYDEWVDRE